MWSSSDRVNGFEWFIVILGFLFDLGQTNVLKDIRMIEPIVRESLPLPKKVYQRARRLRTIEEIEELFPGFKAIIDATADLVCAYKPNLAFYEAMGSRGTELYGVPTGFRELDEGERGVLRDAGVRVFTMSEIDRIGVERAVRESLDRIAGPGFVHVSLDMDALDPAIAPGVGTPVRGGLDYREAHMVMGIVAASQLLGAISAAFLLRFLFNESSVKYGAAPAVHTTDARAFVLEAILTAFLVWAVWATAVDSRGAFKAIAGLAIGLTITMDVFVGGRVTGAAMNPARAFGPELAGNQWSGWWIYWIGPIAGALLACLVYEYLYLRPPAARSGEPQPS